MRLFELHNDCVYDLIGMSKFGKAALSVPWHWAYIVMCGHLKSSCARINSTKNLCRSTQSKLSLKRVFESSFLGRWFNR